MSRPKKDGLDYFPLDVNFLKDIKVRKIKLACGSAAIEILLALLSNIYRDNGYYFGWDKDTMFLVADEVGAKEGLVEQVVDKAIQVGFFDKQKFNDYKILTSKGIQERFLKATERRKVVIADNYSVIAPLMYTKTPVNVTKTMQKPQLLYTESTQSKVKESKVKESKVKEISAIADLPYPDFQAYLKIFTDYGGIVKARQNDSLKAWIALIPDQRKQALQAAENYVNWYRASGDDVKYMKNAFVFLDEMIFTDYLQPVKANKNSITTLEDIFGS